MTTPTRAEMREAIARAMGWREVQPCFGQQMFENENGQAIIADDWFDPFTNAADNHALVEWLAKNATVSAKRRFISSLHSGLADACVFTNAPIDEDMVLEALTAPLEAIALAAWRAIQEKAK